ncbi:MAG: SDR family NAD(P)-dependent oxidoreductase, partial [Gammaproteobacteria bacterium]|nr:SDR family NAD(P)-dependent oxidoreductase [Gammaproteobacteria bacterium]
MTGRVAGKVALVTGGAKGLGEADARALAAEGARVVLTDVDDNAGQAVAEDIGGVFKRHDVTDEARWQQLIAEIKAEFGALHVLVNNAGIVLPGSIESQTYADYRAQVAVSADATFLGCQHAIPLMVESGGGSIINMASVASKLAYSGIVGYAAAKGAVEGIT